MPCYKLTSGTTVLRACHFVHQNLQNICLFQSFYREGNLDHSKGKVDYGHTLL